MSKPKTRIQYTGQLFSRFHFAVFLTIIQSELLYIFVCLQFSIRAFGDTQGDGLDLPVN